MKVAAVALAILASLALASAGKLLDEEGYTFDMRKRLGHFAQAPFTDMYKEYAVAFIAPNFPDRPHDDYRNYRPSADVCRDFFAGFVGHEYQLEELDQVIVLDACLGYVVDGVYATDPDASEDNKAQFAALAKNEKIVSLYQTKLDEFGAAERTCVATLLLNSVYAKKDYPDLECNNHMLQLYIQFAECQAPTPMSTHKKSDPYVAILYGLVKSRVNKCVEHEISHMNRAVREQFGNDYVTRASLRLPFKSVGKKQQLERKWPSTIRRVMNAVQNTTGEINLRQVHQLLASVQHNDDIMKMRFLNNIATYADKKIKPRKTVVTLDPKGTNRYRQLVDAICNPFRSSDNERKYDFATPIIRLVELLNHVELFDFDRELFVDRLLKYAQESAPLYLSVSACNLLTFTEGTYSSTGTGAAHYEVHFLPDTSKMVVWPKASYV